MRGLSLKPVHYQDALTLHEHLSHKDRADLWWEVHPENYFVAGGPRLAALDAVRRDYPISLHSVSLNLGGVDALNRNSMSQLKLLIDRYEPFLISDHLAWSSHQGVYFPDLLPIIRNQESLTRMVDRISACQDLLDRELAIENPSHYVALSQHDMSEVDFLTELANRSGCDLLLDLNNVVVSAHNLGFSAQSYLDAYPLHLVREIHLAGHHEDTAASLLIDGHNCAVSDTVFALCKELRTQCPTIPVLIERDGNVPALSELLTERARLEMLQ